MDKNSINDRFIKSVNYLISNKLVANKIDLAESLGIGNTKLSEILNKRMKAGTDLIACLCYKYSINSDWILIGRGSMLPNEQPQQLEQTQSTDQSQIVQIFVSQLEKKDEEIKSLNQQIAQMSEELGHLRPPTECQKDDEQLKPKGLGPAKNASTKKPSSPNADNATSATAQ
ncbi:hypothetical protein [Bacteroides xylanisolvens]|uniref:hypothetical protein n=1 Tax=Bacteroides xylanisolvens TaxID=371601 RepID=UPI001F565191|nr:hypothetical protein [Bacteroides xylanisolvens]